MRSYENPDFISDKRLKQRSYYIPEGKNSYILLNGIWNFKFYEKDYDLVTDIKDWETIDVPSCWQAKGYEKPNYTSKYPFPIDWPYLPDENPCAVYERNFEILDTTRKHYIVLEGAATDATLYINGVYAGYTQGSHMQSEFDITEYLTLGQNTVRIIVHKWCFGSYLEDQDHFRYSGLFRDVYILSRPIGHIGDIFTHTKNDGSIEVDFEGSAEVSIIDGDRVIQTKQAEKRVELKVENPILWNAEKPYLYTLQFKYQDETINIKIGFREVRISSTNELIVNGTSVKLLGVNHHDSIVNKGWSMTDAELRHDLELMKSLNINCIRTSHYPPTPKFLDMCDEMGFYVVLETDLETHGFLRLYGTANWSGSWKKTEEWPCNQPEFEKAFLDRMVRAVERDKNHASIIMWSAGNESGYGVNHDVMLKYSRERDPDRISMYDEAGWKSEYNQAFSSMYPDVSKIGRLAKNEEICKPIFFCEYSHAMGNSPGDVYDMVEEFYKYPNVIGGCIWEWCDHTVKVGNTDRYGGDFGELTTEGSFCCDGVIFSDRTFKDTTYEVKASYQPVKFEKIDSEIHITNRYNFTNLKERKIVIEIQKDAEILYTKEMCIDVEPHSTYILNLKEFDLPKMAKYGCFINFRVYENEECMALAQFDLDIETAKTEYTEEFAKIVDNGREFIAEGDNFKYVFSKFYGNFSSIEVSNKEQIIEKVFISSWRAPTDNDRKIKTFWGHEDLRQGENLNLQFSKVYYCTESDGIITVSGSLAGVSRAPYYKYTSKIQIKKDGTIIVKMTGNVRENCVWLPRLGFEFILPSENRDFTYFGYGPFQSYCDAKHHTTRNLYSSSAEKEYTPYPVPQEHANHTGVKYLTIGDLEFFCEKGADICVLPYSSQQLTNAWHTDEIGASKATYLRVDYKNSGLGSGSCGPDLEPQYRVGEKEIDFEFIIKPKER